MDTTSERLDEVLDALALSLAGAMPRPQDRPGVVRAGAAIRLRVLGLVPEALPERAVPLDIIATRNLVVTVHDDPVSGLDTPEREAAGDSRFGELDAAGFVGMLLDGVVGAYFLAVDAIERRVDALDERALVARERDAILPDLVALRRRIAILRRALAPQREAFAALVRPDFELQREVGSPWPGLADRFERAIDAVENARELLLGSFDIHMSRTAQRTNDVVQALTVISAILLPISVVAGIMGMNFPMPFFDVQENFWIVLASMAVLAGAILVLARLRHWI